MTENSKHGLMATFVSSALIWGWISILHQPYPALLFVVIQAASVATVACVTAKNSKRTAWKFMAFFFGGWILSFVISFVLWGAYAPEFVSALAEQLDSGTFIENLIPWVGFSFLYGGALQSTAVYYMFSHPYKTSK
ncbi:hypothetical protein [Motilimonas sp. E26]|uniref:hypothetical protein n=1 Tax=Motilimonas sp. E26 TaxID=2865674 RepID=UPI001E64E9B0|nr:hypothetical protein [Motilimonas sp. E26]MCE0558989.1 hypothetical protein [Motilimonas sp. E26]